MPINRGKQKVYLDGFMYTKQITSKSQIRWQYVKCSSHSNGGIATYLDFSRVFNTKSHNHDANPMEVAVAKTKVNMKLLAANSIKRTATMVSNLPNFLLLPCS